MNGKNFSLYVMQQSKAVYNGWKELKDRFDVPNRSFNEFEKILNETIVLVKQAEDLREQQSVAVEARNAAMREVWTIIKIINNLLKILL